MLLVKGEKKIAIEFKATVAPKVGTGFFHCIQDIGADDSYIVCPFENSEEYPYNKHTTVISLNNIHTCIGWP